jgi:BCCT family betaine/carnitine transporter
LHNGKLDWPGFATALAVIVGVCLPLILSPEAGGALLQQVYNYIAGQLGWLYLLGGCGALVLVAWLAFGRYGQVILGAEGDTPEFSDLSWIAMLFCAGIGAGMMYWAAIEWVFYYQAPPYGVEPQSTEAARWASAYGIFHWGPTAWAIYCLPTLAIAYPYYSKRLHSLRFSVSFHHVLGGRLRSPAARFIDLLFMLALLGGAGSSLGFSTPLIASGLSWLTGLPNGFALEFAVVVLCVLLFAGSVWMGLSKGIRRLSDLNLVLAFLFLAFILVAGPTVYLLKTSLNGLGTVLENFVRMNSWTDPFTDSGFVESWTVFYWAWWVAFAPFVGLFVTRISRGRSIRQVSLGMLGWGSLGCALFFMVLGNYALYEQLVQGLPVMQTMESASGAEAVILVLRQLPLAGAVVTVFCLVCVIFSATTYDSASYTLASSATLDLAAGSDPARWHRVFWAFALGVLPVTLMFIGDLRVLQTASLVASLPVLLAGVVMSISFLRSLREDHPA